MLQWNDAGDASSLPTASTAATKKACSPLASGSVVNVPSAPQGANGAVSTRQRYLAPSSGVRPSGDIAWNENVARASLLSSLGVDVSSVLGGPVSTIQDRSAGV